MDRHLFLGHLLLLLLTSIKKFFIHLKGKVTERYIERFHQLVYCLNSCNSQEPATPLGSLKWVSGHEHSGRLPLFSQAH